LPQQPEKFDRTDSRMNSPWMQSHWGHPGVACCWTHPCSWPPWRAWSRKSRSSSRVRNWSWKLEFWK